MTPLDFVPFTITEPRPPAFGGRASISELPYIQFPTPAMRLFNPDDPELQRPPSLPNHVPLSFLQAVKLNQRAGLIPRPDDCRTMWNIYEMLPNIREHSLKVAAFSLDLAQKANAAGIAVNEEATYAAAMLHDLGKTYSIQYGGSHAQIGASLVLRDTRNPVLARAVLFHVDFPWNDRLSECAYDDDYFVTMSVFYADKRVRHDEYVTLDERFDDLAFRYGKNAYALERVQASRVQGKFVEAVLSERLGVSLDAYTPDYGRLVR